MITDARAFVSCQPRRTGLWQKLVALIGVAGVSCQVASVWQLGQGAAFAKLTRGRRVADGFFWLAIAQARRRCHRGCQADSDGPFPSPNQKARYPSMLPASRWPAGAETAQITVLIVSFLLIA